jgi:hypothetical protein
LVILESALAVFRPTGYKTAVFIGCSSKIIVLSDYRILELPQILFFYKSGHRFGKLEVRFGIKMYTVRLA